MIPINLIRQYHFCPRIVYYNLLTNIKPTYPKHVQLGSDYHTLQNKLIKHRRFKKLKINYTDIITEQYIEDKELGIGGIVDLFFICKDEVVPIEFKFIEKKPSFSNILQVVAYGLILEKEYNLPFKKAYIIYSNNIKFYKVEDIQKYKKSLFKTINEINEIVQLGILPDSSANEHKCSQCEYLNFCDDRL